MKANKILCLLAVLLTAVCLLTGCGEGTSSQTSSAADTAVTVTDMKGRTVTLAAPATRIVAVTPADCEILYELGVGETVVGRGTYCDWPQQVTQVPVVEAGAGLNVEQIISLSPQLVVMGDMGQTEEQVQALEKAGVKVLVSDAHNIAGTYETIEMLGKATGKNAEALALVMEMKNAFEAIRAKSKNSGKTVYFEVSPLEYGLWSAGKNTFMDEIAAMLGLTNIFADLTDWGEVSEEQVIERNPDYIVTVTMYFGEGPTPEEEILSRKGWESIGAVKNKQVFRVDSDSISRPGPRLTEAAEALYAYVYGDATNENS